MHHASHDRVQVEGNVKHTNALPHWERTFFSGGTWSELCLAVAI